MSKVPLYCKMCGLRFGVSGFRLLPRVTTVFRVQGLRFRALDACWQPREVCGLARGMPGVTGVPRSQEPPPPLKTTIGLEA